jgi:hypothetical protein
MHFSFSFPNKPAKSLCYGHSYIQSLYSSSNIPSSSTLFKKAPTMADKGKQPAEESSASFNRKASKKMRKSM